jgi:sugar phosphate isomerase/epimerase
MSRKLRPALITSFVTAGMADPKPVLSRSMLQLLEGGHLGAEIYCFMLPDARMWAKKLKLSEPKNAVEFLAQLSPERHLKPIAASLVDCYESKLKAPIVALATFVPEVAVPLRQEAAVNALAALIRLALEIGKLSGQTPVIELVAGSRLSVNWNLQEVKVELTEESRQRNRVLGTIDFALQKVAREEALANVRMALELEPGEMFLLRNRATVEAFLNDVEASKCDLIQKHVGFNLDVSHFRLAEVSLDSLRDNERFRNRCFHAHLSGHHPFGHYGDTALCAFEQGDGMKPWLSFLQDIAEENPRFSGFVSLEYEAARSPSAIRDSLNDMFTLLKQASAST